MKQERRPMRSGDTETARELAEEAVERQVGKTATQAEHDEKLKDIDAVLDEIEDVLAETGLDTTNQAKLFVQNFTQKGGQ